jgi:oligopeptide/dipeptide ABC transporter ATP-binding protein
MSRPNEQHEADKAKTSEESGEAPLLEVRHLRTWFPINKGLLKRTVGHVRAVDDVSFTVQRGKTLALVGESGCGKTTVGRSILRLLEPKSGQILFEGQDLLALDQTALRPLRRAVQMVFQDPMTSLNPRMRVVDLVAEGMDAFRLYSSKSERTERVAAVLKRVQLSPDLMNRFPHEFSGGQRQRLGIARALAVEPRLMICDEAVSALDVSIQAQILNLLAELQDELGLSYLFITHDLSVVRHLADDVAVMYLGQIMEYGPAEQLFASPQHPYTKGLLASVPSPDPDAPRVQVQVLGDAPSPAAPPAGCRFHTRCPVAEKRCTIEVPELIRLKNTEARCLLLVDPDPG